jgi:tripartite-type tricarboxylate transporter receptor subunit TctC
VKALRVLLPVLLILAVVGCGSDDSEDSGGQSTTTTDTPFKSGDQLTFVVPTDPGGGFDTQVRTLQPHLETALKEVTGADVSVIVQNVPGAGGQVALEQLYRDKGNNRKLIVMAPAFAAPQQVVGNAGFDIRQITALAQLSSEPTALLIRPDVIPDDGDFADLVERSHQKPILYGTGNRQSADLLVRLLQQGGVDLSISPVIFNGTSEAVASLLRGELEVYAISLPSAIAQVQANPSLRALVHFGAVSSPIAPDVPTLADSGIANAGPIASTIGEGIRVVAGPPGMSDSAASALRKALATALQSTALQDDMHARGQSVAYADAGVVSERLSAWVKLYEDNKDVAK